MRLVPVILAFFALSATAQIPGVEHVVVIGVDGLSPVGLKKAHVPNIQRLIAGGAYSFKARAVMPTVSAPNWASMIMGAGPEQHGIIGNKWPLPGDRLHPTEAGTNLLFPTIFRVLREARPDLSHALVHDWDGFAILFERAAVDTIINGNKEEDTTIQAVQVIKEKKPNFLFIHLDLVDHALHSKGFESEEYFAAVEKMDSLVARILDATREAAYFDKTLFILTSDHGGKDRGHGGNTMEELIIPWIAYGPGVTQGKEITEPINIFDTASTIAYAFGVQQPYAWIGRPVLPAFQP